METKKEYGVLVCYWARRGARVPAGVRLCPRAPGSLLPCRGPSAHPAAVKACQPLRGPLH